METLSHVPPEQRCLCILTVLGKCPSCPFCCTSIESTSSLLPETMIKLHPCRQTKEILQPWPGSRTPFVPNIDFTPSVYFEWSCLVYCYFYCISDLVLLVKFGPVGEIGSCSCSICTCGSAPSLGPQGPLCPAGLCCVSDICFEWAFPLLIFR